MSLTIIFMPYQVGFTYKMKDLFFQSLILSLLGLPTECQFYTVLAIFYPIVIHYHSVSTFSQCVDFIVDIVVL